MVCENNFAIKLHGSLSEGKYFTHTLCRPIMFQCLNVKMWKCLPQSFKINWILLVGAQDYHSVSTSLTSRRFMYFNILKLASLRSKYKWNFNILSLICQVIVTCCSYQNILLLMNVLFYHDKKHEKHFCRRKPIFTRGMCMGLCIILIEVFIFCLVFS